ncbi:MAG: hypothetical protein K2L19_01005 [Eubacterium sp.]|nr:hypothetical protein [Eubacterium sp.]
MLNYNFKGGEIVYDEFHTDFSLPFSEQIDCLSEDLVQAVYVEDYILDIGWYPECNPHGAFVIKLVKYYNWDNPFFKAICRSESELINNITEAVDFIK